MYCKYSDISELNCYIKANQSNFNIYMDLELTLSIKYGDDGIFLESINPSMLPSINRNDFRIRFKIPSSSTIISGLILALLPPLPYKATHKRRPSAPSAFVFSEPSTICRQEEWTIRQIRRIPYYRGQFTRWIIIPLNLCKMKSSMKRTALYVLV